MLDVLGPPIVIEPRDKCEAMAAILAAMRANKAIPADLRPWMIAGLQKFLRDPDAGLDRALGLKVKQGGRALSTKRREQQRNAYIVTIASQLDGSPGMRAHATAKIILGTAAPPTEAARLAFEKLREHHADMLPESTSTVRRIILGKP